MDVWPVLLVGGFAAGLAACWIVLARGGARHVNRGRFLRRRGHEAEVAALDAALTDPEFDPEQIRGDVNELLRLAEAGWDDEAARSGPRWTAELRVWLDARRTFLGPGVCLDRAPTVDVLRVVNRAGSADDHVVVRVRWRPRRLDGSVEPLDERWMLVRRGRAWVLVAAHGDPGAATLLHSGLISAPDVDAAELRHAGLAELAAVDAMVPAPREAIRALTGRGRSALMEASAVDARFMPDLVASTLARLVDAWSEATSGQPAALKQRALPGAIERLLNVDGGRRVLDDARLEQWTCERIDHDGPTIAVALDVSAAEQVRYAEAPTRGSARDRVTLKLRWTLRAIGPPEDPWTLVAANDAGRAESGAWGRSDSFIRVRWGPPSGPR